MDDNAFSLYRTCVEGSKPEPEAQVMALFGIAFALERVAGALASIADLLIEDRS